MKNKYSIISAITVLVALLCSTTPGFAMILGTAENFAVLGSSTVENTGSSNVTGDLGLSPGPSVVGFASTNTVVEGAGSTGLIDGPGLVSGTIYISDDFADQARTDAIAAYIGLAAMPFTGNLTGVDLGSFTVATPLTSGVYHFDTSAGLTGDLVLDGQGLDNAYWAFLIGSTLTTAPASSVTLINPGLNNGVYWQVGSSATLDTTTLFLGNILADQSVTLNTGANILCGRIFALNAAVKMDTNDISGICDQNFSGGFEFYENGDVRPISASAVPEPATLSLLGLGLLGLVSRKNKLRSKKEKSEELC